MTAFSATIEAHVGGSAHADNRGGIADWAGVVMGIPQHAVSHEDRFRDGRCLGCFLVCFCRWMESCSRHKSSWYWIDGASVLGKSRIVDTLPYKRIKLFTVFFRIDRAGLDEVIDGILRNTQRIWVAGPGRRYVDRRQVAKLYQAIDVTDSDTQALGGVLDRNVFLDGVAHFYLALLSSAHTAIAIRARPWPR